MTTADNVGPDLDDVVKHVGRLKTNLERVIRGKAEILQDIIVALLAGESVLIEDVPGVGKTTLAKALAASIHLEFRRVQCTPDLLPADILGCSIYSPASGSFEFRQGPIFCNILLVDEINRASPRTQSALLEAMAEHQVTVEGHVHKLPEPFLVIATQNPAGYLGTYPLPESQLDRFLFLLNIDYPDPASEVEILYGQSVDPGGVDVEPVLSIPDLIECQEQVGRVHVDRSLAEYLVEIVNRTREHPQISLGVSPRGSLKLFRAAQARALLEGRSFVLPDDIQQSAPLVFRHRIVIHDEAVMNWRQADQILRRIISEVEVPV